LTIAIARITFISMATLRHPQVTMRINRKKIPNLLARAKVINNAVTEAAATFTALTPAPSAVLLQIQQLDLAQQAVGTHDLKADALMTSLESWRSGVQILVDANPEQAFALAELAGMSIANVGVHAKPLLAVKLGQQSGAVVVEANLGILKQGRGKAKKRTLNWRYTTNGGTSYASAQSTPVASTVLTGLTPLTIVGVQVCITDSNGTSEWSQVVTLLVR
jgi:hypothetical protein